jgi:4-coumarate--CoA ligase
MPATSPFPDIDIPAIGIWDALFERKSKPFSDDHIIYYDPYTKESYSYARVKQASAYQM